MVTACAAGLLRRFGTPLPSFIAFRTSRPAAASRGDALSSTVGFAAAQLLDDAIVRDGVADHVWRRTVREK